MKVAMVCPLSPSGVRGGAERLWEGVVTAINNDTEHEATLVGLPSAESTLPELIESYRTFDALTLDDFDVVITGKYPAWMVRHRRHVVHMCHTLRGLYDTYPAHLPRTAQPESAHGQELIDAVRTLSHGDDAARRVILRAAAELVINVPTDHPDLMFPGPLARELIHWLDADGLHPTRIAKYMAISETVARRDGYFPTGVDVEVVVPPSALQGLHKGPFQTIFTASRLDGPKRIGMIIEALRYVTGPCELRIAGTGPLERELREQAYHDDRITLLGAIDDEQLIEEYANALVVPFVPAAEDLGLIALEAQMSGKPVVTCTDSGGVVDLVDDGADGLVVEPNARALGTALSRLVLDPSLARTMGARGERRAREITWRRLVDRLLEDAPRRASNPRRGRIVMLNTYAAEPARHGGQVRVNRLLRSLGEHYDVHYIALTEPHLGKSGYIFPGVWQSILEPSPRSREIEALIAPRAGVPVGDVAALLAADESVELLEVTSSAADKAAAVILTHPYLFPCVRDLDPKIPIIYDSQNAEWSLKGSIYPASPVGRALAAAVAESEAATMRRATLITAVSDDDVTELRALTSTLADFAVVPNGVDVTSIDFVSGDERRDRRRAWLSALGEGGWTTGATDVAVFMGSGHPPNVEAARAVLRTAAELDDMIFVLVGSHVDELAGIPTGPNVIARGIVDQAEMGLLLSMCTVALNPMRAGSGTNIKMLDYFAAGAPTVASAIGARGLGATHNVHLLLADSDELVTSIDEIRSRPDDADRLARSARELAMSYDWKLLGEQFRTHIDRAVAMANRSTSAMRQ